jgi:large subunit ribosomal protein L17
MRKRVKRLNLNTTKRSHDKLLLKNLFTSLVVYGKVTTTETKARALKSFAQAQFADFAKITESRDLKRWANSEISTEKFLDRAIGNLQAHKEALQVTIVRLEPRKGDNASQYEVSIINFDPKKRNEQQNNVA